MSRDHAHHHHHGSKNILLAFALNAVFALIELVGGYLTNSVAIYSDALHDFGDSLALLFSYFAEKLSQKEADEKFTYGYRRFSVLSAFINGIILLVGSLFVIFEAINRISTPEQVKPEGMLVLAFLGIIVNAIAAYRLSKDDGMNQRMVMLHLLEDILGWISVLIVSLVLLYKPWYVLDSILSILISLIVLRGVYKNFMKVGAIFLQKFPDDIQIVQLQEKIKNLELVQGIHAVRGWSIDEVTSFLSFHISVPSETTIDAVDELKHKIKKILKEFNVENSSIEFESTKNQCSH